MRRSLNTDWWKRCGRNGGVRLERASQDISLFDVVRVTEENFSMAECFENDAQANVRFGG
ncbi:Rrf2 family transcriptional regulator [Brucella abortus]|nr:Rrf2 family transcriptional regulator [Brucella abortus]